MQTSESLDDFFQWYKMGDDFQFGEPDLIGESLMEEMGRKNDGDGVEFQELKSQDLIIYDKSIDNLAAKCKAIKKARSEGVAITDGELAVGAAVASKEGYIGSGIISGIPAWKIVVGILIMIVIVVAIVRWRKSNIRVNKVIMVEDMGQPVRNG